MIRTALVLGLLLVACRKDGGADKKRVAALNAAVDQLDGDLSQIEHRVYTLSQAWSRLIEGYSKLAVAYQAARRGYDEARRAADAASATFKSASDDWKAAQLRWELYREIVLLAVEMDQGGTSKVKVRCNPMSTASFRRLLIARGIDLAGKDIDHIVPHALGGADDPANYQILDSSLNRSLGKTWNVEKCLTAGRRQCTEAVAVSSRCGSYQGGGFW